MNDGAPPLAARPEAHRYRVEEQNRALVRAIGRPRTVLDVGCGIGLNGAAAKRKGAYVTGIETSRTAIEGARRVLDEVLDLDIADSDAVKRHLDGRRFDLMLLGDVLEHLPEPARVLERLVAYLDDGGHAIISVPNVAAWTNRLALLAGRWHYQPSGILDETHLRFFTLDTARSLVKSAGLEVLYTMQNPMLVRAAKDVIARVYLEPGDEPTALGDSVSYKLYQGIVRPLEDLIADRRPELFAFQHVIVARRPPLRRRLTTTVGLLTMDEEQSVARMIGEVRHHAPDADILCVDSSTRDKTPEIARSLGARVIRQIPPRGHGPAMEQLMAAAAETSELLVYLDCDFTYPPEYIPVVRRLVEQDGCDVVNCARTRKKPKAMPWPNYLANRGFAAMAHALHGIPTVDVHSGMRAYRCSVIRAFDFDGEGDALPIDTLLYPAKCGYRVVEMPISYDEREGTSKLRRIAGTAWTLIRLGRAFGVGSRGGRRYAVR